MKAFKLLITIQLIGLGSVAGFSQTNTPFVTKVANSVKSSITWYHGSFFEATGGLGCIGGSVLSMNLGIKKLGPVGLGTSLFEILAFPKLPAVEWAVLPLYVYYPVIKGKPLKDDSKRIPWFMLLLAAGHYLG